VKTKTRWESPRILRLACLLVLAGWPEDRASAAAWYLDSAATGAGDGTSWRDAWTTPAAVQGLAPGDTVYISGGASGQSQSYPMGQEWSRIRGGTPEARITYRIGRDTAHSGTAVFLCTTGHRTWIPPVSNVAIIGDAGDGRRHFQLVGWAAVILGSEQSNVRVAYLSADGLDLVGDFNPATGIEIDHCWFRIADLTADHATYAQINGTTWDDSRFHHNTLYLPNVGDGAGSDGLQWNGCGFSIYDNTVIGYLARYSGGQHQDGWQGTGNSSYIKIYNNRFQDMANYSVFADAYHGGFSHLWIFNNVITLTSAGIQKSDPPQGIAIGPDGDAFKNLGHWPAFTDIVVCNNVIADYGNHLAIALQNNPGQASIFTACIVADNADVNSNGIGIDPAVARAGNIRLSPAAAGKTFLEYSPLNPGNDFHLSPDAGLLIARGANLSRYADSDKEGVKRRPLGGWDVGAYARGGAGPAPIKNP